jgi:hypothetical protein
MWVLIVVMSTLTSNSIAMTSAEFDNLTNCTIAANKVEELGKYVTAICVKK